MMKAKIEIQMDNAAFEETAASELARILRELAAEIEEGCTEKRLRDANGNTVGNFSIEAPMTKLIEIPAVGEVRSHMLDVVNRTQVQQLIARAEAYFKLAAKSWVAGNNSGNGDYMAKMDARCDRQRRQAETLLKPLGIKVVYPGLYPSFEVGGFHYHTTEAAVKAATEVIK